MSTCRCLAISWLLILSGSLSQLGVLSANGAAWPTYQQNARRNAYVPELIGDGPLSMLWRYDSASPPQPAWYGPAKWDAYSKTRNLHSMRNYDPVFHIVAADGFVYWGSSVDDSVVCADGASGQVRWRFTTDGPVRVPPTIIGDRLYFGSDDGHAYCLNAGDGSLNWRFRPAPADRLFLQNGRFIPFWPIRTGVAVEDNTAYFCASLLPWKKSYLCAVNAVTGKVDGPEHYVHELDDVTMEGPVVVSGKRLIIPQGRVAPTIFSRATGKLQGSLPGGGGSFVVLTPDDMVFHGPGNKSGWIEQTNAETRERVATHKNAIAMVVANGTSYMLSDTALVALGYESRQRKWVIGCDRPQALIVVGNAVIIGGIDHVTAYSSDDGAQLWTQHVDGSAQGLAYADGRLLVSTDRGSIFAFAPRASTTVSDHDVVQDEDGPGGGEPQNAANTLAAAESPEADGLQSVSADDDVALLGQWVFQQPQLTGTLVKDLTGHWPASIEGDVSLERVGSLQALKMDGDSTSALITDDHRQADQRLPQTEFTAEAWVRVDTELEWGGFIGAVQDDGNLERGWLLGFRGLRPSLAVGAQDGPGGITYLTGSDVAFVPRKWHHVAGTYDGKSMKLYLDGKQVATSNEQRGPIRYPDKTFYEIGAYHDGNEYHVFTGALHEVRLYKRALSPQEIDRHFVLKAEQFPPPTAEPPAPPEYRVAVGPWLKFTGPDQAVVRWHTKTPCPTILTWRRDDEHQGRRIEDPSETTEHRVVLRDLKHRRLYYYSIEFADGKEMRSTPEYECDLFFNYVAESRPDAANPNRSWLASQLRRTRGQALVIGAGNEGSVDRLIEQLLEQSEMHLFVVDSDVTKLERYRQRYLESGAYGARIATYQIPSLGRIPVTNHIADFAAWVQPVLKDDLEQACRDVARRLAPKGIGIVAVSKGLASGLDRQSLSDAVGAQVAMMEGDGGLWVCWQAPRLGGSGDWSHAYGRADNSAYGGEMLSGVRNVNDLDVQWIGRPGPRYQADRNGRKNPPIATDDRLFLQGLHRIVTLSAHNGTILWSLEIPYLERYNLPRDCANWSADERNLFATVAKNCLVINAAEGEVENVVSVHDGHEGEEDVEWGYVANDRDLLFGSAVFSGASWLNYVGGPGWYDMTEGEETHPVCSLSLFALDKQSRRRQWCYRGGRILNSTICIAEGRVNFIECREAQVMSSTSSRVGGKEVWEQQFLVTLDARTGDKIAEAPVDTVDGTVAFWMARAEGRLIVVSSADVKYHVYSFDERDGRQQWSVEFAWGKGKADHGSHLSRPAIVGDTLFVRPAVIDLTTGKVTLDAIPVGGCGTYACTAETLIFRAGSGKQLAVWDKNNGDYTRWSRLRPDCWLSTIPAAGMLLSPEGGGGCSCGSWLETSIGFIPKKLLSE